MHENSCFLCIFACLCFLLIRQTTLPLPKRENSCFLCIFACPGFFIDETDNTALVHALKFLFHLYLCAPGDLVDETDNIDLCFFMAGGLMVFSGLMMFPIKCLRIYQGQDEKTMPVGSPQLAQECGPITQTLTMEKLGAVTSPVWGLWFFLKRPAKERRGRFMGSLLCENLWPG